MIMIKNKRAIEKMRKAGRSLAEIMVDVKDIIKPGITTLEIDNFIESEMKKRGLKPECKGYAGYKHATCISVNDVVVHGVPSHEILKDGDFVKIDVVASFKGYCADMARFFFVGNVSDTVKCMGGTAQKALDSALEMVKAGINLSNISHKIQTIVEGAGFGVVRDFAGHGIGRRIHELPEIPNFGAPGKGVILREGMTLAIEPMITERDVAVRIMPDGWTARTVDGGLAAHVEDTIAVTKDGIEVLTRIP